MWYSHTRPWKVQPVSSDLKFWIGKNILVQQFFQYLIEEPIIKVVKIIFIFSQVFLIWHSLSRPHTVILCLFILFCVLFLRSFLISFFHFVVQNYAKFMLKQKNTRGSDSLFLYFQFLSANYIAIVISGYYWVERVFSSLIIPSCSYFIRFFSYKSNYNKTKFH